MSAGTWLGHLVLLGLVCATAPAVAQPKQPLAPTKADCEFFEIAATTVKDLKDVALDPALKPLEKKLKKHPFKSYNMFKVLAHGTQTLEKLKSIPLPVKVGKTSTMLVDIVNKSKVQLVIQIDDPTGKRTVDTKVTVEAGDYVVLASDTNDVGHLLALTCK